MALWLISPVGCALANFTDYILSFRRPVLSDAEVSDIRRKIENSRLEDNGATRGAHVQNLRNRHRR